MDERSDQHTRDDADGLRFEIVFPDSPEDGLAWGDGYLYLGDDIVWSSETDEGTPSPLNWTWIDLLEFLGRSFRRLALEETYPLQLSPTDPTKLREEARRRWQEGTFNNPRRNAEDEALFRFEEHHDLARAMRGVHLPSVFLMREGEGMWVCTPGQQRLLRMRDVLDGLEEVGDRIASRLADSAAERARAAVLLWDRHDTVDLESLLVMRSGLQKSQLELVEGAAPSATFWEMEGELGLRRDSELLAAARMTASTVQVIDQRKILDAVRSRPHTHTPELDELSALAARDLRWTAINDRAARTRAGESAQEGYDLAQWLRRRLQMAPDERAEPGKLLHAWGVVIVDVALEATRIDAVACWGPRHGPVVVVNTRGVHAQTPHGRRSTLAHEMCHLLVDRRGALPLAEAIGGSAPRRPEQRARAFAAEFLAPRAAIERELLAFGDVRDAVKALCTKFAVGRQIIGWQIINGTRYDGLTADERAFLEQIVAE